MLSLRLLGGWMQAQRLRRIGVRPATAACRAAAARLAARLRIRRAVQVLESTWIQVPVVVGWLRPAVLVPASAFTGLAPQQLEMLLAHELAHVRRHDYLVNLLQSLVETLFFYHPAVWWVSQRVRAERENCCDDLAVAVCGDARAYARALVELESLRAIEALPVLAASGGSLVQRVRRLVAPPRPHRDLFPRWAAGGLCLVAVFCIVSATRLSVGAVAGLAPPAATDLAGSATGEGGDAPGTHAVPVGGPAAVSRPETALALAAAGEPQPTASVTEHPNPGAPLGERWEWALAQARARKIRAFWIGYAIDPSPHLGGPVFSGHIGASQEPIRGHGISLQGRIVHVGRSDGDDSWIFPGAPLPVSGDRGAVALLYEFRNGGATLLHAHAASLVFPVDLEGRPLLWLGPAGDAASLEIVQKLETAARGLDARVDLVGALGVHASSALVVPLLLRRLEGDAPTDVRQEAAEWLGRHPHPEALAALARAARSDRSADVRREAAESVGEMSLPAAADTAIALARTLRDPDARREAVESLGGRSDERSLAALADIARKDRDASVRQEAAETLGERPGGAGVDELLDIARSHPDPDVRREAVEGLGQALPPDRAREVLRDMALSNSSQDARREAVETLSELPDGIGLPDVRELARSHPDPEVRREAVEQLGQMLPGDAALDLLVEIAHADANADVQREAVQTLGQRPERRAQQLLVQLAREHPEPEVRREAVETLGEAQPPDAATPLLFDIAHKDPHPDVQREAVETLAALGDARALDRVEAIARNHPSAEVRREAIESLGEQAPERALALLRERVRTDPSDEVRREVLDMLAELPDGAGVPDLIRIARSHPDAEIRREALRLLVESSDPRAQALFDRALKER